MAATTAAEANKELVRRLYEGINEKKGDELLKLYASDCVIHGVPGTGVPLTGHDALEQYWNGLRETFPDITASIEALVAEDDLVAVRVSYSATHEGEYLGVPATGEEVSFEGTNVLRIEDEKIAEVWPLVDTFSVFQQIGGTEVPAK